MRASLHAPARVIDLVELRGEDAFPAYVAIYSEQQHSPFALSPVTMRWSETIHLCRLEDCKPFWLNQKKKLRCKLQQLFDPVLSHHHGADYVAVFADHPWQCLWYLQYQLAHHGAGIYFLNSPLDQNIYRGLDWDSWFDAQQVLREHLAAINAKGYNDAAFAARQSQFRRFVARIGIAGPFQMKQADANAVARRFGAWMGRVWDWSIGGSAGLALFPWLALQPQNHPCVRRELEYPVNQWSYIEVLLREDFAHLCEQFYADDCEHINRMRWEITLFNLQKIRVELSFRHPYSLHRDAPAFDTALYQARYIYNDLAERLQAREHDLDLPESMPFIDWRLEVCERIQLTPMLWELFADAGDQVDYQKIMRLQNKLPLALESYQCDLCFYPQQSFHAVAIGAPRSQPLDDRQWSASSLQKPLFYYADALQIEAPSGVQKFFLERGSSQWWLSQEALQSIRDYYILKDRQGRASWVYRTQNGEWYKLGEYC